MKTSPLRLLPIALAGIILLESCSSYTVIQSRPTGAKLYLNDLSVGVTPYRYSDTKIVGSATSVRLEKEGYAPLRTSFSRNEQADVGAIIGGIFFLFPFLWTMKYSPTHDYELMPVSDSQPQTPSIAPMPLANDAAVSTSKATRLREIKKLLDDGILTKDEYEKEKKKILDADN